MKIYFIHKYTLYFNKKQINLLAKNNIYYTINKFFDRDM
ncbi:hypothetical protein Bint_1502 [Brachyspira intermedia PWS/A]|uniref:Uncharacterized protein n=1 Tax=Brachyspira intermedia (strain ATCC 51140 / PWS/A) TaxID=1045858 RepID=G0EQM0_BRAIP|nr:hypothetical protein Bint_1502 [Brachyspira intermedia PWS/A]